MRLTSTKRRPAAAAFLLRGVPGRSPGGLAGALLGALLLACTGTASGGIGTASGFNLVHHDPGDRRALGSFSGPSLTDEGETITDGYIRDQVAVVNFWGSWCGPCREEQPILNALHAEYAGRGVRFLGMNVKDGRKQALAFRDEFDVAYPSIFSPDAAVAAPFRVRVAPSTFVVDTEGRIAVTIVGAVPAKEALAGVLDAELARAGRAEAS